MTTENQEIFFVFGRKGRMKYRLCVTMSSTSDDTLRLMRFYERSYKELRGWLALNADTARAYDTEYEAELQKPVNDRNPARLPDLLLLETVCLTENACLNVEAITDRYVVENNLWKGANSANDS